MRFRKPSLKNLRGFLAGLGTAAVLVAFIQARPTDNYFEVSKNLDIFATLFKELNTYYVDTIEPGKMVKTGIDAILENLDPYTNYITESDIEDYEFQTTGKYGGIGASMHHESDDVVIGEIYENSPAQKAGLHPGDMVISIDNQQVKGKTQEEISTMLKGAPGTQIAIQIKDAYNKEVVTRMVTRGEIEISSVPYAGLVGPGKDIAFVRLTQFTPSCGKLVRNAFDSLKTAQPKLKACVLDLRNNPGGLLDEAVNICNIFTERGQLVVSTKGKMQEWDKDFKTYGSAWDVNIPVAIIVNHSSASASEIVAGTLQDLDRAVVIGERSYGKGLVQTTRPLGYNARLKLTTAKYYTPSGRCIQAIDYSHRNPDGSVGHVPDSLKKPFKTKDGRKVLSGGGVEPDLLNKHEAVSKIVVALFNKNYLFDYATLYASTHKTIPGPDVFSLSSADVSAFTKWLEGKDYSYKTDTEILLDSLQKTAKKEKYFDAAKAEFATLQAKVSHDKKQDLLKHQDEVVRYLEAEIVTRYYYQRGKIAHSLKTDTDLEKALALLAQPKDYEKLLVPGK